MDMNEKRMDVTPRNRSIRSIPLTRRRGTIETRTTLRESDDSSPRPQSKRNPKRLIYILIALVVLFVFLFSTVFASGKLIVSPKFERAVFDSEILSTKDSSSLPFEIMTIEKTASKEVKAAGEKFVEERATGKIIIYNNFDTKPQRLIKNTRFESSDGLIYRIGDSVDVPGKTTVNGESVAGSIEVTVFADAPGSNYNIGLTDFTVPGFKGTAQFDNFYARSKTPMTGGFSGNRKIVSESDKNAAIAELQEKLRSNLFQEASSSKTDGYVIFNDSIFIEFENLPDESKGDNVVINQKAILYGVIFDKKKLSSFVASKTIASYSGQDVLIENLDEMDFTTINKQQSHPWQTGEITFNLLGNPVIVWQFDEAKLKEDLAGSLKKDARAILTTYPSIERAEINLSPFWKRSFPDSPNKIRIVKRMAE
jgi:hypothetical protein